MYGDPIGYKVLRKGTPVVFADGVELGTVAQVRDNAREHIFDGLVVRTADGRVFVDAPEVDRIYERGVTLTLDAAAAEGLPEPSENPAAMAADPDDVEGSELGRKLRSAWDRISGNY